MAFAAARWDALGTTAGVVVTAPAALPAARAAVEAQLRAIDLACSRFREDSELSRLNARAGRPTAVGPLLLEAIELALRAAALTDGLVDPTIGRALALAGYDRDFAAVSPRSAPLRAVRVEGPSSVTIDRQRGAVRLARGVQLDLGATAKALAADRAAAAAARAAAGAGVLVDLGGDVAVAGPPPRAGWRVGVGDDHRTAAAGDDAVTIASGALATSSTTVRRWGPGAHHIVDPRTGLPAHAPWRTVTVAAATCADANIASTAAVVLGDGAPAWLRRRALPARLVGRDGRVLALAGWPAPLAEAA